MTSGICNHLCLLNGAREHFLLPRIFPQYPCAVSPHPLRTTTGDSFHYRLDLPALEVHINAFIHVFFALFFFIQYNFETHSVIVYISSFFIAE